MSHTTPITIQNVRFYEMMIIWQTVPLRLGVWALCRENLNFQFPLSQNIGLRFPNTQLTTCIHFNWWEKGNQQSLGPSRAWLAPITFEQKWFEKPKGGAGSLCSSLYVADLEPLPFSCQFQSTSNSIDAPDRLPLTFVRVDCKKMAPIRRRYASSNVHNIARYCMIQFVMSWSWVAFDTVEVILNDWNETGPGWVKTEKVTILFFSI